MSRVLKKSISPLLFWKIMKPMETTPNFFWNYRGSSLKTTKINMFSNKSILEKSIIWSFSLWSFATWEESSTMNRSIKILKVFKFWNWYSSPWDSIDKMKAIVGLPIEKFCLIWSLCSTWYKWWAIIRISFPKIRKHSRKITKKY